jgi:hypothetical protein
MPTKDESRVRINGGEHFFYKLASPAAWVDFGIVKYGYELGDAPEIANVAVAGGNTIPIQKQSTKNIMIEMAQTGKSELELRDTLNGKTGEIYIYDGIVGDKHLMFYAKASIIWVAIKKKEGEEPQVIQVTLSLKKQAALCAVADTGLPTGHFAPVGTHTGVNNYYVWIEGTIT